MFYLNNSFNNNIVWFVLQSKEELVLKIDEILAYEWCETNKFYVSKCETKAVEYTSQKIDNGQFIFDSEWKPVFDTNVVDMVEEKEIVFEFDVLVGNKIELDSLLSNI